MSETKQIQCKKYKSNFKIENGIFRAERTIQKKIWEDANPKTIRTYAAMNQDRELFDFINQNADELGIEPENDEFNQIASMRQTESKVEETEGENENG